MDLQATASRLHRRAWVAILFFIAASASFSGYYNKWHFREPGIPGGVGTTAEWRFGVVDMLEGTALRPFAYRCLLPYLATWIDRETPQSVKERLYGVAQKEIAAQDFIFVSPVARNPVYFFRYLALYGLTFLFTWLAVCAMYLVCKAIALPPYACLLTPVLMILLMPYLLSAGGYYYDYPELAFLALAVWMAWKFDWWWMLPLIALATWNKESFLLAIPSLYPIWRRRASRKNALLATSVLMLVSAGVYLLIRHQYLQNPGGTLQSKWRAQLGFFLNPMRLLGWERTYGIPNFKAFSVIPLVLIVWTCWRGWRLLPVEIRRYGQIAAAINIPLFLLFCSPGEIRDLSLLYVVFMLLIAVNLGDETGAWGKQEQKLLADSQK
jgi:hypothetical protein